MMFCKWVNNNKKFKNSNVMWGLLLVGSQSSKNIRWLVTHSKYFANKVLCSTWHFFHGGNVICFMACNQTFVAFDAQGSNFKAIHVIVTNYTYHNLVGIYIYGLVVTYFEKCPCWWILIMKLPSMALFLLLHVHFNFTCIINNISFRAFKFTMVLLLTQHVQFTTNQKHLEPKNVLNYEKVVAFQQPSIV